MFDSEALLRKGAVAGRGPIPKRSPQVDGLPDIIRSRVGPQVVTVMSSAIDRIIAADVHTMGCLPDDGFHTEHCPTWIARDAAQKISDLRNIAVTAGPR